MMRNLGAILLTLVPLGVLAQQPADQPAPRQDENSAIAHRQFVEKAKQGTVDVYFVGDSITRRWGATDYPNLLANWRQNFYGWNAANFGWGGDATQNILWRLQNGELEGVAPKVFIILAGTNNVPSVRGEEDIEGIVSGIEAIIETCRRASPDAAVILTAIFPRYDNPAYAETIEQINARLKTLAEQKSVRLVEINPQLVAHGSEDGATLFPDKVHPSIAAYQIWADALRPILTEVLGPPAQHDSAPPPTGDPSAVSR